MTIKKVHENQPKEFKFSDENMKKAEEILKKDILIVKKKVMPFCTLLKDKMIIGYH